MNSKHREKLFLFEFKLVQNLVTLFKFGKKFGCN